MSFSCVILVEFFRVRRLSNELRDCRNALSDKDLKLADYRAELISTKKTLDDLKAEVTRLFFFPGDFGPYRFLPYIGTNDVQLLKCY